AASVVRTSRPTAPLAPTTATLYFFIILILGFDGGRELLFALEEDAVRVEGDADDDVQAAHHEERDLVLHRDHDRREDRHGEHAERVLARELELLERREADRADHQR